MPLLSKEKYMFKYDFCSGEIIKFNYFNKHNINKKITLGEFMFNINESIHQRYNRARI